MEDLGLSHETSAQEGGGVEIIDTDRMAGLTARAAGSPRLRANHNLHPILADPVQRFLNAMEPGTYVRPHRHSDPERWELFLALSGSAVILTFDGLGRVVERAEVAERGSVRGVEVPAGVWHAVACLEAGTVLFELKPGPYVPASDKDFASWAPAEGQPECAVFEAWYRAARVGDSAPRRGEPRPAG
jgi:cupin fold WbuC family metalloprotein